MDMNCPDQIIQWMEFPFEFINPEYKAGLDFSMESLKLANQGLGELKAGMKDWPQDNFQQMLNMVVLGWGAYIGETVRRSYPGWTWDFPDPSTGELPQLVHEGLGGVGRMVWPAVKMALARLHDDELDVALCTRIQMEEVVQAITRYENNRELWEKELEGPT